MSSAVIQLLVLAGIAIFLILRLRSVLGTREGFEKPPVPLNGQPDSDKRRRRDFEVIEGGIDRDITDHVEDGSSAAKALASMKLAEPGFGVGEFLQGARGAYEMILMAFEQGERVRLPGEAAWVTVQMLVPAPDGGAQVAVQEEEIGSERGTRLRPLDESRGTDEASSANSKSTEPGGEGYGVRNASMSSALFIDERPSIRRLAASSWSWSTCMSSSAVANGVLSRRYIAISTRRASIRSAISSIRSRIEACTSRSAIRSPPCRPISPSRSMRSCNVAWTFS